MSAGGERTPQFSTVADGTLIDDEEGLHRFLRCGHILGSLLKEMLEESYLGERCTHSLTRTQFCLLKLITTNADVHPSEVARYLGVSPAAVTKNVDKLERLGLVHRDPCAEDRRATLLSPSAEGRRVVTEYEDLKTSRMSNASRHWFPIPP